MVGVAVIWMENGMHVMMMISVRFSLKRPWRDTIAKTAEAIGRLAIWRELRVDGRAADASGSRSIRGRVASHAQLLHER